MEHPRFQSCVVSFHRFEFTRRVYTTYELSDSRTLYFTLHTLLYYCLYDTLCIPLVRSIDSSILILYSNTHTLLERSTRIPGARYTLKVLLRCSLQDRETARLRDL